jgi:hypothetical protein
MQLPFKTVLFPGLSPVYQYLAIQEIPKYLHLHTICDIYSDKIVVDHKIIHENMYMVRMWKTKAFFNYWHNDMCSSNSKFIAALDYSIHPEHIKIEYMNLNDDEYKGIPRDKPGLTQSQSSELNSSLILYVKELARKADKKKVIVDVHSNLRIFNKYYHICGFDITDRRCTDNPYWLEAEYVFDKKE